ncbi:MAG: hypothetical protein IPP25_05770 [Saprospiraceae bacterium]|nr:hypothetical protein [Candidatus Opimibacter skivensis]
MAAIALMIMKAKVKRSAVGYQWRGAVVVGCHDRGEPAFVVEENSSEAGNPYQAT